MSAVPWILISVGALLVIFLILAIYFKKQKKCETDYYTFFVLGVTWLPMGILFMIFFPDSGMGIFFIAIGTIYTILGLAHKKDWKKNQKISKEKRKKLIISIILGILVFAGLVVYYIFRG